MQMLFLQTLGLLMAAYFVGAFVGCLLRLLLTSGRTAEVIEPAALTEAPAVPAVVSVAAPAPVAAAPVVPPPAPAPVTTAPPKPLPAAMTGQLPAAGGSSGQGSVAAIVTQTDDLTLIRGIDAGLQTQLGRIGITRFADIASWRAADVQRVAGALGLKGRIAAENWVEQAQVLAKGELTKFARTRSAGGPQMAQPTAHEGTPKPIAPSQAPASGPPAAAEEAPRVAERAAFAQSAAAAAAAAAVVAEAAHAVAHPAPPAPATAAPVERPATGMARDDLKRIAGINGEVERLLAVQGVTRYAQIAEWDQAQTDRFDRLLGVEGRIAAENWIDQARVLAGGGATAYSRELDRQADTVRPPRLDDSGRGRSDIAVLRSVRSEAYRGDDTGPYVADDLKRIRGIGVLIEKRLAALGVTTYEQIANWSESEIRRISQSLEFKGRIERENWVEQARILASGGQTEFSRRVDRGDVETSRATPE